MTAAAKVVMQASEEEEQEPVEVDIYDCTPEGFSITGPFVPYLAIQLETTKQIYWGYIALGNELDGGFGLAIPGFRWVGTWLDRSRP